MKRTICYICAIAISISIFACSPGYYLSLEDMKQEAGIQEFPSQKDYPEADAIILYEMHDVKVEFTSNWDLFTYETVQKTTKLLKNIEDYASVEIPLYNGNKVMEIMARTIRKDGSIVELQDKDFFTTVGESDNSVFYSDTKKVKFTFPSIEKDCIIEYQYKIYKDMPFVQDIWLIQHTVPTLVNTFRLTAPNLLMLPAGKGGAGWNWRYLPHNYELGNPVVINNLNVDGTSKSKNTTFEWKLKNIEPFEYESMMDSYWDHVAFVKFSPSDWAKWNDVSEWYNKYFFQPQLVITDKIKSKAAELTKDYDTEKDKIQALSRYVQKIRYEAIELGDGSIRPTFPEVTMERAYGDCKDKSILLISLLKSIGVDAKPVLVLTADNGSLEKSFPSWRFNHMIVKAEDKDKKVYWVDPTVTYIGLGNLPWACEDINVLTINEDGSSIFEKTPSSRHFDNLTDITINAKLDNASKAHFEVSIVYKGELNSVYRYFIKDKTADEMNKFCKSMIIDDYLNATIDKYSYTDLDSVNSDLILKFKFTAPNPVQKQTDLYMVNADPFKILSNMGWLEKEKRKYPLRFDYPSQVNKKITIEFPDSLFSVRSLPDNLVKDNECAAYSISYAQNGSREIYVTEKFAIKTKDVAPSKYAKTRELFENIKKKSSEKLILTAK